MKAIFEIGGSQQIREEGDVFLSEKVPYDVGETFSIDNILSLIDGESTVVGTPHVNGAKVEIQVLNQGKAKKVVVVKYKPKKNYRVRRGHRQHQSQLKLVKIHPGG